MSKRRFIQEQINSFKKHATKLPDDLQTSLEKISNQLAALSDEELEQQMTSVVSSPAGEQEYSSERLAYLLHDAVIQMEQIAKEATQHQYDLLQAYHSLLGELGLATDPPAPE